MLVAHGIPEGTADSASVGPPVKDGAHHFHFAGPSITMFSYVAVEAQSAVVLSLAQALLLQVVNGKNGCVSAVSAANRNRPIFQIRDRRNRSAGDRDDLGHPAEISVPHGDCATSMAAPFVGLEVGKVWVPGNIYAWHGLAWLRKKREDLGLVALK